MAVRSKTNDRAKLMAVHEEEIPLRVSEADARRTVRVHRLYEKIFGRPWPKGWQVLWHIQGLTDYSEKTIFLAASSMSDPYDFETVVHELHHMADKKSNHTPEFYAKVRAAVKAHGPHRRKEKK